MKTFLSIENNPDNIRALLQEVLSRSEFDGLRISHYQVMVERLFESLRKWNVYRVFSGLLRGITEFIVRIFSNPITSESLKALILILVGILLFLVASIILKRLKLNSAGVSEQTEDIIITDPGYYEKKSDEYAKKGEFVEALRQLYLSLLLFFSIRGILEFSHSRTNREIEILVSNLKSSNFSDSFSHLNSLFEEKVYALQPCTDEDFRKFRQLYHQCRKGAASVE
jgi:hypothetical protein